MASLSRPRRYVVSTEENKALIRLYVEAIHEGNVDEGEELLAPDFAFHVSGAPGPMSSEAFRQLFAGLLTAFPDMAVTVEDLIAEGDRVAARVTTRGTHAGELIGLPPTGRRVEWSGISMTRHAGGKIVEQWGEFDALGLLQQLSGDALSAPGTDGGFTATPEEAGQLYER
jgi:steroid delta-isomerase-like uncharacterized protein